MPESLEGRAPQRRSATWKQSRRTTGRYAELHPWAWLVQLASHTAGSPAVDLALPNVSLEALGLPRLHIPGYRHLSNRRIRSHTTVHSGPYTAVRTVDLWSNVEAWQS